MQSYDKFKKYIISESKDIDFNTIYDKIFNDSIYDPVQICNIIIITMYALSESKRLDPTLMEYLSYNLSLLKGEVYYDIEKGKAKKVLGKIEILHLIQSLDKILNKDNELKHNFYI